MEMRDMRHLPRDMHIPVHPAVKNDEKFFHCRETGDGDAGYGASPQEDGASPAGYASPGLSQAKNRKILFLSFSLGPVWKCMSRGLTRISPIRISPIGLSPLAKVHCTFANKPS